MKECKNIQHGQSIIRTCRHCTDEQLDRIEAKLDLLLARSAPQTDYAAAQERERVDAFIRYSRHGQDPR